MFVLNSTAISHHQLKREKEGGGGKNYKKKGKIWSHSNKDHLHPHHPKEREKESDAQNNM